MSSRLDGLTLRIIHVDSLQSYPCRLSSTSPRFSYAFRVHHFGEGSPTLTTAFPSKPANPIAPRSKARARPLRGVPETPFALTSSRTVRASRLAQRVQATQRRCYCRKRYGAREREHGARSIASRRSGEADRTRCAWPDSDPREPAALHMLALALLQGLPSPRASGARASHHPMGSWDLEQHAAPACPLHALRRDGRDADASHLGRRGYRSVAIPGRSAGPLRPCRLDSWPQPYRFTA
jgi:hypothetical protein